MGQHLETRPTDSSVHQETSFEKRHVLSLAGRRISTPFWMAYMFMELTNAVRGELVILSTQARKGFAFLFP
jgi:hypothetical protein